MIYKVIQDNNALVKVVVTNLIFTARFEAEYRLGDLEVGGLNIQEQGRPGM